MCQLASLWSHFTIGTTSHHVVHCNPTLSHFNHVPNLGQANSRGRVPPPPQAAGGAVTKGDWVSVSEESVAPPVLMLRKPVSHPVLSLRTGLITHTGPLQSLAASTGGLACRVSAVICASLSCSVTGFHTPNTASRQSPWRRHVDGPAHLL